MVASEKLTIFIKSYSKPYQNIIDIIKKNGYFFPRLWAEGHEFSMEIYFNQTYFMNILDYWTIAFNSQAK